MRFLTTLLISALAIASTSAQPSFPSRVCTDAPGTCTACVGLTNCCYDTANEEYGHCGKGGPSAFNCPDGSKFTCNGGNCNKLDLTCNYEAKVCEPSNSFCWGTITCPPAGCPEGYAVGDFCHQDGNSAQFKVCGSSAPEEPTEAPTTEAPTTEAPATEAPATEAPVTEAPVTEAPTSEPTTPIGPNPTQAPEVTEAPTMAPTSPPATEAPATEAPATEAPATEAPATEAPATEAPATEAPVTQAPTVPATQAPTMPPTMAPTEVTPTGPSTPQGPEGTVCYQTIVGSMGTYAQVEAVFMEWAGKAYLALGLTGASDVSINWAQVPDRVSFENGCDGPYTTVADLFVHIDTNTLSNEDYESLSAKLEAFIAANPLVGDVITCSARSVTDLIPICGIPSTPTGPSTPQGPDGTVCYQEIVGSMGSYASIKTAFADWALKTYQALGLTGAIDVSINYAQVPDRVGFENGCDGPFTTVADLFVHINTANVANEDFASLSAKLEAWLVSHPLTAYSAISCSARSVTDFLPVCGLPTTAPAVTQAPATTAPTTPTGGANPNPGGEVPTPNNVVCYQEVVGSLTGSYAQISADLDLWQQKLYTALGLTGPLELQMGHAQIPDRVSFENGCNGPYANMADLFVHIQTTAAEYDAVSAKLEAFIAANPLTTYSSIDCMARSVVTYLPTCGKLDEPTPTGPSTPQNDDPSVLCFQQVVGSSSAAYGAVSAQLDAWEQKLYTELGLSGPLNLNMGHAQIPDRVSFENGCDGPYQSMADLFVYIPTTFGAYDALSAKLEAFIAANPFNTGVISCSARSVVSELPYCGKIMNPGTPAPPTNGNGGANPNPGSGSSTGQTCPAVAFTPTASNTGISVAINTPDVSISFMDVHITTSAGFFNYRMAATSATTLSLDFPAYLTIGAGQSISYWFTTASTSAAAPAPFACDSASFSYTADGTPSVATPTPATPAGACPSIAFDYAIERTGAGASASSGLYAITFASATPAATVDWVDVHVAANGGSFNYRMDVDAAATGFIQNLPSPHLELATGTSVAYSFTYQAAGVACDTATYTVVV